MSATYYKVKLNNGDTHIVYAEQDVLESMYQSDIIAEYTLALDSWSTQKVIENYVCEALEEKVHDICFNLQNAKGIKSGDCPPDLYCELDSAIENVYQAIIKIISYEEEIKSDYEQRKTS